MLARMSQSLPSAGGGAMLRSMSKVAIIFGGPFYNAPVFTGQHVSAVLSYSSYGGSDYEGMEWINRGSLSPVIVVDFFFHPLFHTSSVASAGKTGMP